MRLRMVIHTHLGNTDNHRVTGCWCVEANSLD